MNAKSIPERDPEILRNLYARKMNNQLAYDAILQIQVFRTQKFPIKVNDRIIKLLMDGVLYIYGRDKCFRPLVYVNAGKIDAIKKQYTSEDFISLGFLIFEFLESFMSVRGRIENLILIIDCLNINVFTAPYSMLKALMTTI